MQICRILFIYCFSQKIYLKFFLRNLLIFNLTISYSVFSFSPLPLILLLENMLFFLFSFECTLFFPIFHKTIPIFPVLFCGNFLFPLFCRKNSYFFPFFSEISCATPENYINIEYLNYNKKSE